MDKSELKIKGLVDNILKNKKGGNTFFDDLDSEMKKSNNLDLIESLFNRIYEKYSQNFNLVVSGGFGDFIIYLIRKDIIKCKGSILQLTGSLTSHFNKLNTLNTNKSAVIVYQKGEISNKEFIFVDDSYYSGTTGKVIDVFLSDYNSSIINTFIMYDGNDKKSDSRNSLFNYYDHFNGNKRNVWELLTHLYKQDDIPYDVFEQKIIKGSIITINGLISEINKFKNKVGDINRINTYNRNKTYESKKLMYIKRFKDL